MNRLRRTLVLVGVLAGIAQPATADVGQHCAFRLVPLESLGVVTNASLDLVGCFGTYEQALQAGMGEGVDLGSEVTPQTLTDEVFPPSSVLTGVLIGTEYDGAGFTNGSTSYFAATTCTAVTTWQVANVGPEWNDRFQSGKGFGGCDTNRKYQHENFAGTVRTCTPNCSDYGALSNQVTSLRWRV
jgi:hypothetical protein